MRQAIHLQSLPDPSDLAHAGFQERKGQYGVGLIDSGW